MTLVPAECCDNSPRQQLATLRLVYFCCFGALGAIFPFLPPQLHARGLTPSQISWVMALIPLTSLVSPPLWGAGADALRARSGLLAAAAAGTAIGALLLLPASTLGAIWGAMAVFCLFRAPLAGLADALTHAALGGQRESFAKVRVWGSLGYALLAFLMGYLSAGAHPTLLFGASALLYLLAALAALRVGPSPVPHSPRLLRALGAVFARPRVVLLLVGTVLHYAGHGAFDAYYGLHLRRLGHGDALLGLAWSVGVTCETVLMLLAPALLRGQRARLVLPLSAMTAALRWLLIAGAKREAMLLAIQPLHALTFGLWYLSLVKQVQDESPEALRASFQGVAAGAVGCGGLIGYLGGGSVFQHFGGSAMFRLAALCALAACAAYTLSSWHVDPRTTEPGGTKGAPKPRPLAET